MLSKKSLIWLIPSEEAQTGGQRRLHLAALDKGLQLF